MPPSLAKGSGGGSSRASCKGEVNKFASPPPMPEIPSKDVLLEPLPANGGENKPTSSPE
jgi:hypothetical protein